MRLTRKLAALAAVLLAPLAWTQTRESLPAQRSQSGVSEQGSALDEATHENSEDVEFLLEALRTGLAEIEMGALAERRTENPAVREYGRKLQADHARSVQAIESMLSTLNVTTPSEPTVEAQAHRESLEQLSGAAFDAAFVPLMVASHEEAIEQYGAQTHANPNKALSALASEALPMLREHLAIARSL